MDPSRPFAAVSPGVESDVLVVLAGSSAAKTGREVARLSGRSPTGVQHALDRLVEEGLVDRGAAGQSFLYLLNRSHLLAPAVEVMAGVRWELIQRLRALIGDWQAPAVHSSLFGSAARGEGNPRSDIDLLVVRPMDIESEAPLWRQQVDRLAEQVLLWTGNHAGTVEISENDISRLRQDRPAIVDELLLQGIDLAGRPIRELLKDGQ